MSATNGAAEQHAQPRQMITRNRWLVSAFLLVRLVFLSGAGARPHGLAALLDLRPERQPTVPANNCYHLPQ